MKIRNNLKSIKIMTNNKSIYVAAKTERCGTYEVSFVKECDIARLCRCFNNGFEAFLFLCFGCFIFRAPNEEMLRFEYCPRSGKKIDWDKIYEEHKHEFKDYDKELEDKVKNGDFRHEIYKEYKMNYRMGY